MAHCVVDKFIVVPHWYMAVPSRDLWGLEGSLYPMLTSKFHSS